MAKSFASVEWLSQSSSKEDKDDTSLAKTDQPATYNSWTPEMGSVPEIGHVAPYPGTQGLIYPWINYASSCQWDNEKPTSSKDCEVPSSTVDNQKISPSKELSQMDMEISHNSTYNGQCNASENFDSTSPDSSISQEHISSSQESYESRGEQTRLQEDMAHSAGISTNDSGYDSETSRSRSDSPESGGCEESSDVSDEEGKVGRRLRTAFTTEQITTLENTFQKHRYLGASERRKLAAKLNLSEVQIKTWFQNRRMKHKREIQEGRQIQFHPAQFYGMYGYPTIPPYQYTHPGQPLHVQNPLDPMSYNYPSPPIAFDSLNPFNPMIYLHQQSFIPPAFHHEEKSFTRY